MGEDRDMLEKKCECFFMALETKELVIAMKAIVIVLETQINKHFLSKSHGFFSMKESK